MQTLNQYQLMNRLIVESPDDTQKPVFLYDDNGDVGLPQATIIMVKGKSNNQK